MRKMKQIAALGLAVILTALTGCSGTGLNSAVQTAAAKTEAAQKDDGKTENAQKDSAKAGGEGTADAAGTPEAADTQDTAGKAVDYPVKPIQMLLPAKPGGDIDMNGRLLSKDLEAFIGKTVVPVTMDGGRGNEALQTVAEGEADGYQFVYFNSVMITSGVIGKMNYLYTDFRPVAVTSVSEANVCVVSADSKYSTLEDLIADAKANPGTVRFPVTLGANSHFQAVAFEKEAGVKLKKLDAASGGDKAIGIISGQMETFFTTYSPVKDYVESGKMRVLGVIGDERSPMLPDVPTFKECGINMGDEFNQAYCMYVHKGTPEEIVKIMQDAVVEAMQADQTVQDFTRASFIPKVMINKELDEYLQGVWDFYSTLKEDVMNDSF